MRIWLFKYDRDGYDKEGFDREGRDRWGRDRDGFNRDGFDRRGLHRNGTRYDDEGYGRDGFDQRGFGRDGFDRKGRDREGYDREGFDQEGRDRDGFDRDGFARWGRDRDGFDRRGFDRWGRDREGRDREGFDRDGFDREGFGRDGFDRRGIHRNGTRYDDEGYDQEGFGRDGLDREGFDKEYNELPTRKQGGLIVLKARVKRLERLAEISNGLLDKLGIESAQQEPSSNADVRLKLPRDDASDTAIAHFQKISEFYSTHAGLCPRCGNQLTDPPYVSNADARILLCDVCGGREAVCGRPGAKARENFWRWENWVANSIYESNNVIDHVQSIARFQAAKPDACPRCGCPMSPQHGHKLGIASKIEVCSHCHYAESSHRTEARSLREHVTVGSFYDWNEWFASDKEVQQLIDKLTQLEKTRKEWERRENGRRQIGETILNGVIDSLFEK